MTVGSFGDVVFSVTTDTVRTLNSLSLSDNAAYVAHSVHGLQEVPEYTGLSAPKISFSVTLSAFLGLDPMTELEKLRTMLRSKKGYPFALGSDVYGDLWILTDIATDCEYFYRDGTLMSINVRLSLLGMEAESWRT